jgi:hypothetical protein
MILSVFLTLKLEKTWYDFLLYSRMIRIVYETQLPHEFSSRITCLITNGDGGTYSGICFNSRRYYGYSGCLPFNAFFTINRIQFDCVNIMLMIRCNNDCF